MSKHEIVVDVKTRRNISAEEIAGTIGTLIDIGLGDAQETVEDGEGNTEDAELALALKIGAPRPLVEYKTGASPDIKSQAKALHAELKGMNQEIAYSTLVQALSRATTGHAHQVVKARERKEQAQQGVRRFTIELDEAGGQTGRMRGELSSRGDVSYGLMLWKDEDATQETVQARLSFEGQDTVTMTGDAWRNLEMTGQLELFVRLAALSPKAAQEAADLIDQEGEPRIFIAIATRDAGTESCTVYCASDKESDILEEAEASHDWQANDNFPDRAYLGGGKEDIEETDLKSYLKGLMSREIERTRKDRAAQAFALVEEVSNMDIPTSKECKAALQGLIAKAQALLS